MEPPRFFADAMLGRLARWLRVLGFDAAYDATRPDPEVVRLAEAEDRLLLTRDRHLLRELRPVRALEIRRDPPLEQLREVIDALALQPPRELFTRCLMCNTPLSSPLAADEAAGLLPPSARDLPGPTRRCPNCRRIYWPGSHARRMRGALEQALPGWVP
ncbi:MAG TPA: Mut7-C RNAse domain-containing protein [Longimicrobium sp.]|nr:Mut7-C RNAse domain-containing protein [Longimicrobium sp.]